MSAETVKTITGLVIVGTIAFLVLYDIVVYALFGSDPTISRVIYGACKSSSASAAFALGAAFTLGVLFGHLFLPMHIQGPPK